MQDALQKMLARVGKTKADFNPRSNVGKVFRRVGVAKTPELERVLRLPRRVWAEDEGLEALRLQITEWLRAPGGTMVLRPVQAKALEEIHDFGGMLAPIRVGGGKTLISALAPVVVGAQRPLLLVPAKLRKKTLREFHELRKHWLWHPMLAVVSYEKISRDGGQQVLETIAPDLIIGDEAHRLKNTNAGVTRKIRRWMKGHPETLFLPMSGTITTRSLRDYGHLAVWALKDLCPLPKRADMLADWADALDEKVKPDKRLAPGALLGLCTGEELDQVAGDLGSALTVVRQAYRRRLVETPGVIATEETALGVSLEIMEHPYTPGAELAPAFEKLRELWETPDGHPFTEAVELWRHARELACGLFYRWDPPAPPEWLAARKAWAAFVRQTLGARRNGIDTEFQVAKTCKAGDLRRVEYDAWQGIRDTFKPNSVPVWVDDAALQACARWMEEGPGIVWTEHVAFGERLSELTGRPYFGSGGECRGVAIEEASGPVIASIASNGEGRNLQGWNRNLVSSAPPNGRIWEQMLGRTHREGQEADEVTYELLLGCREQWEGMQQALADAEYIEHTTGQPQKLLYADLDLPTPDDVMARVRARDPMWIE